MHLDGRNVLHVVDTATSFQAARFLRDMTAKHTWETLKACWIDTYLGPPDFLAHDAGTNFAAAEFRAEARLNGVTCRQVPVEAHWSIGKVERYHAPLRRAYEIFRTELAGVSAEFVLQMAVKAVNDTAGPDGLVPTLLVFGAYPRMTIDSAPSPTATQRAVASAKALAELRKIMSARRVKDALRMGGPKDTLALLPSSLPIGSEVLVFREKGGWQGPFRVVSVGPNEVTIDLNGPSTFRSTHVKP